MQEINFNLERDYIALNDLLKLTGLADSGGAGKALVAQGLVSVDGQVESRKTAKIRAGQRVSLGDACIQIVASDSSPTSS